MKVSSLFKVVFDFIMFVLLAAIYCVHSTGMAFHEYAGLGIYLFFIIHLVYNYKWIINAGKKLFDKSAGARVKVMYAVDLLLLTAFILIGFSGIMISHIVFRLENMPVWRPIHSAVSAFSVILIAIHIGLHGKMIINTIKNKIKIPFTAVKIILSTIFVIMTAAGIYGDIAIKSQPVQNEMERHPRYETVLALFEQSITLLIRPPEHLRNRSDREGVFERGDDSEGFRYIGGKGIFERNGDFDGPPPKQKFNIMSLFVSVSNYISIIILLSIIVYITGNKLKKKKPNE